ncbi:MAG: hypothetical protein LBH10_02260 [Burkholderiaceae bacterium]|jgi:hypothetical protein|nr:hypothetical protein [Burkholderiaceae bacterium]
MMERIGPYEAAADASVFVQELAARNLQVLRAIEDTLTALWSDQQLLDAVARGFMEVHDWFRAHPPATGIDPHDVLHANLILAAQGAQRMYTQVVARHKAACADPLLTHEDGVTDAYKAYLDTLETLFDTIESLKDWVETHDDVLEPSTGKIYKSVDDLFSAMGL